jgi:CoA-dependent NAD(P)H sulfur oxidoreductase
MNDLKIVVIGGDAAGMSAASKVKRESPDSQVVVFERDQHISYAACGIPYWLAGTVETDQALKALSLKAAREKRGIDVRIHHEVTAIDLAHKIVQVTQLKTGESFAEPYDRLVIATGASPISPPIPGLDLPGVFTLRSLTDGQRIQDYLQTHKPQRGVIVGGGYIGLEMAETFRALGMETSLIEMLPQIMPNMDAEMVQEVGEHLVAQGIQLHTNTKVSRIAAVDHHLLVHTDGAAQAIPADIVLVSTGVRPNSELAQAAGLALGPAGAIQVDSRLRTSAPDVYAAGDCVAYRHLVLNEDVWIPLAPSANKGGRIIGENLVGEVSEFPGILGTAVVKVFDYSLAVTGLTERLAQEHRQKFAGGVAAATITAESKPNYYPGNEPVKVKLVIEKATGRLLGAQLASRSDVSKRTDVLAVAITAHMTVEQIGLLDLTYAPPYAPVYDPVLVAANVAARQVG